MSRWRTGASIVVPAGGVRPGLTRATSSGTCSVRLVGEHAVRRFAVLAQALAMVGGDDDQRRPRQRRQALEERPERGVHERDLAVVRLGGV